MKKCTFYSLVMGENNKPIAKKWDGYTDNIFNYYKNEYNQWYAIEKSTGLSVGYDNTRKNLISKVTTNEHLQKVRDKITQDLIDRFTSLVEVEQCL